MKIFKKFVALIISASLGCAPAAQTIKVTYISPDKWPEVLKLPPTPEEDVPITDDRVVPLSKGSPAPFDGILLSEDKAKRAAAYKSRYLQLRLLHIEDQKVWVQHRDLYETQLKQSEKVIKNLQPGWWDIHKFEIGIIGGLVLGIGVSAAVIRLTH